MNRLSSGDCVAIAVVPRDRFSTFPRCLEALYANTDLPFRVSIAAGNVDPATKAYLAELRATKPNLTVVLEQRLLSQRDARRIALEQVNERYCVVLENDTIVHQNWLGPLLGCMREEAAAAVMPLVFWYRGIHSAGCAFDQRTENGAVIFRHRILYTELCRKPIDYPESHCILIDRKLLGDIEIFDDVEPFDADLGLTLRRHGLSAFLEPRSVVTYDAPPPWQARDVLPFTFRWDPALWQRRNQQFTQKWGVTYDSSRKRASYHRQQLKLGIARWYPTAATIAASNVGVGSVQRLVTMLMRGRPWGRG